MSNTDFWEDVMGDSKPIHINEWGGKSTDTYQFDLLDPHAIAVMARVLTEGAAKKGEWNWRLVPVWVHLRHALGHIFAWLGGDRGDDHLGHALVRLMMAVSVTERPPLQEEIEKIAALSD